MPPEAVRPEIPSGWKVEPQAATIEFSKPGEHTSEFKVLPDGAQEARYSVRASLHANGRDYSEGYSLVARPDIGGFFYYQPALQRASVVEVKVPPDLKVGYIMGAGDDIPTCCGKSASMSPSSRLTTWSTAISAVSGPLSSAFVPTTRVTT